MSDRTHAFMCPTADGDCLPSCACWCHDRATKLRRMLEDTTLPWRVANQPNPGHAVDGRKWDILAGGPRYIALAVAAVNALPALLDEIDRLRAQLATALAQPDSEAPDEKRCRHCEETLLYCATECAGDCCDSCDHDLAQPDTLGDGGGVVCASGRPGCILKARAVEDPDLRLPWLDEQDDDCDHSLQHAYCKSCQRRGCPTCGPGYRYGDDGCRHTQPSATEGSETDE